MRKLQLLLWALLGAIPVFGGVAYVPPYDFWISFNGSGNESGSDAANAAEGGGVTKLANLLDYNTMQSNIYAIYGSGANIWTTGVRIHLAAGNYETHGINLKTGTIPHNRWQIFGVGMGQTVIKHIPGSGAQSFEAVISGYGAGETWEPLFKDIRVSNLTLDCNFSNLWSSAPSTVLKSAGIRLQCDSAEVDSVEVINFGSSGQCGLEEVFPISIQAAPRPCEAGENPATHGCVTSAVYTDTRFYVNNCWIEGPVQTPPVYFPSQPYCTGIIMGQSFDTSGQAYVESNTIRDIPWGIGFGGAAMEGQSYYEDNLVEDVQTGFNFDTLDCNDVYIWDNTFRRVTVGGNIGPNANSAYVKEAFFVDGNTYQLTNAYASSWHVPTALRIGDSTRAIFFMNNSVTKWSSSQSGSFYGMLIQRYVASNTNCGSCYYNLIDCAPTSSDVHIYWNNALGSGVSNKIDAWQASGACNGTVNYSIYFYQNGVLKQVPKDTIYTW